MWNKFVTEDFSLAVAVVELLRFAVVNARLRFIDSPTSSHGLGGSMGNLSAAYLPYSVIGQSLKRAMYTRNVAVSDIRLCVLAEIP